MPLTWDTSEIKDYAEKFPDAIVTEEEATMVRPAGRYWNEVTNHLVMQSMRVGLGSITEKNVDEWIDRYQTAFASDGYEQAPVTPEQIKDHIGLRTNVSTISRRSWNAKEKRLAATA